MISLQEINLRGSLVAPHSNIILDYGFRLLRLTACIIVWQSTALINAQHISNPEDALLVSNTLRHIWPTGGLQSNFLITQSDIFNRLRIPCLFTHGLRVDYEGNVRSSWDFPGITTYLIPDGRDFLRWQPLSGTAFLFALNKIAGVFPTVWTGPCMVRRLGAQQYEVKTRDGTIWKYAKGILNEITIVGLGSVRVECRGTYLSSLKLEGNALAEMEVEFNGEMEPVQILKLGKIVGEFEWDSSGRLLHWSDPSGKTMEFEYDDNNLLSGMKYPGVGQVKIAWQENKGWQRGDSKWPLPFHLAQFRDETYSMALQSAGYVIKISSRTDPAVYSEFSFNPLSLKARVRTASQTRNITFER